MIAAAMWVMRLVAAEPPAPTPATIGAAVVGDRLVASALPCCTWTVIRVCTFGGQRMVSLRWGSALILREESQLRDSNEEWRRA